ncbi:MAG: riboflavin synthase [Candidatus Gastranaerophilales bacterium]|nr:riboflavin synthase [Candidatus Gastranaerophilales bacterium]
MFTGLIEKIATVKNIALDSMGAKIFFETDFDNVKIGDSIAINGVCLTMTSINDNLFSADIMKETLNISNLKNLKTGDEINLERAMKLSDRLDGHIVSGHIDCTAKVKNIIQDGFSKRISFFCNTDLIIKKGSIAINGVSLTVCEVGNDFFEVSLIPETIKNTNLKNLKTGDLVNIEYDLFAKYIQKFSQTKKEPKLTFEFLKENGF